MVTCENVNSSCFQESPNFSAIMGATPSKKKLIARPFSSSALIKFIECSSSLLSIESNIETVSSVLKNLRSILPLAISLSAIFARLSGCMSNPPCPE